MIAAEAVANAAPDGYTLHMYTANDTVNLGHAKHTNPKRVRGA
jgi:hypothetical protein